MIITKEQWKTIDDLLGWVPWDKDERETKYAWIEPTEIAPPKDWVPACIGGLKYRNEPECEGCIYQVECKRA